MNNRDYCNISDIYIAFFIHHFILLIVDLLHTNYSNGHQYNDKHSLELAYQLNHRIYWIDISDIYRPCFRHLFLC
jgi:hypothetical protein